MYYTLIYTICRFGFPGAVDWGRSAATDCEIIVRWMVKKIVIHPVTIEPVVSIEGSGLLVAWQGMEKERLWFKVYHTSMYTTFQ